MILPGFINYLILWVRSINNNNKALCIGINSYASNPLYGCVNDALEYKDLLEDYYHFSSVETLLNEQATRQNVINKITNLIMGAKKGSHIVITYSGHGASISDRHGDEEDKKDETWRLYDTNLVDDDIRGIISKLPDGVNLTVFCDSCYSGTVTRDMSYKGYKKVKCFEPLLSAFDNLPPGKKIFYPEENMREILISGCKDHESSYDSEFNGKAMGAFTHFVMSVLKNYSVITYENFYDKLKRYLPNSNFLQSPQLEGNSKNKKKWMFV